MKKRYLERVSTHLVFEDDPAVEAVLMAGAFPATLQGQLFLFLLLCKDHAAYQADSQQTPYSVIFHSASVFYSDANIMERKNI